MKKPGSNNETPMERMLKDLGLEFTEEEPMPRDFIATLHYALFADFPERNAKIFLDYYLTDKSLREIGDENDITVERVRQLINLVASKLRHPYYHKFLRNGIIQFSKIQNERSYLNGFKKARQDIMIKENIKKTEEENKIKAESLLSVELITLYRNNIISYKLYNTLSAGGYGTVGDIIMDGPFKVYKTPKLGRKRYSELVEALVTHFDVKREDWTL